jgi:hypothetical protein
MEIVWFTLTGIMLYLFSDWLLNQLERMRGKVFANRQVVFFLIFLPLALISFEIIQRLNQ